MSAFARILIISSVALAAAANALAQSFAPTPPPVVFSRQKQAAVASNVAPAATPFSIGDPTDDEQMHLELINRARADASAEAARLIALAVTNRDVASQLNYWQVDTNLMKAQFATNPPAPPLSFNAALINAARGHSQYQFDNAVQAHDEGPLSSPGTRALAAGYVYSGLGENVFTNSISAEHGHAAFEIDWGPGPGGMQTPPGHRNSIHNGNFVEVGIGIVKGYNTFNGHTAGPQVITEDFGRPSVAVTYLTGVAYYDLNGNNFYDIGEGLPGVQVTIDSVTTTAVTTTSGGYSIPVPPNRSYTVHFNASGLAEVTKIVSVGANNLKVDFKPAYNPPKLVTGPATPYVGLADNYTFSTVGGATGYRARISRTGPEAVEGAEGALDHLTITTTGGYPFISTARKASGTKSFHLGHVNDNGDLHPQSIAFNERIYIRAGARVDFKSMLAVAADGEIASLDVSEDNGGTWITLWSQVGADVAGEEMQFSAKSADLAPFEGKRMRVRFVFDVQGLAYTMPSDPSDPTFNHLGWYLDDIAFVNADAVLTETESTVSTGTRFAFTPASVGTFLMDVQAIDGARTFPYGPVATLNVQAAPAAVTLSKTITGSETTVNLSFTAISGNATNFAIESAPSVGGPWTRETATPVFNAGSGTYTVSIPRNGAMGFYRVVVN
jgi:uncharacterized protein YkwD